MSCPMLAVTYPQLAAWDGVEGRQRCKAKVESGKDHQDLQRKRKSGEKGKKKKKKNTKKAMKTLALVVRSAGIICIRWKERKE